MVSLLIWTITLRSGLRESIDTLQLTRSEGEKLGLVNTGQFELQYLGPSLLPSRIIQEPMPTRCNITTEKLQNQGRVFP